MMPRRQLPIYTEPLTEDERLFLIKKELKDRTLFYRVLKVLMVLCFICPFAGAWFYALGDDKQVPEGTYFSYSNYFLGVGFLLLFVAACAYIGYKRTLEKLQADLRHNAKIVERAHIIRRQYMRQNDTYYFYIDSPNQISIEVSAEDYRQWQEGDELNIEYTAHARLYLGYF